MANYFVDSTTGSDGDNGTTMDLAWATIQYALQSGGLDDGDYLWIRRLHSETPTSDINVAVAGGPRDPIRIIGWPRYSNLDITAADWTNGSTTVDNIVGLSMSRESHLGRYITAPDGYIYFITRIIDSNTIIIDKNYAGSTVTGGSGASTIHADEDYDTAQVIDDSTWTIKTSAWNADSDDLAQINWGGANYGIVYNQDYCHYWANMDFVDSGEVNGTIWFRDMKQAALVGCLFLQNYNYNCLLIYDTLAYLNRVVMVGNQAAGSTNNGLVLGSGYVIAKDVAIYGWDYYGIRFGTSGGTIFAEGLNVGVELPNDNVDISFSRGPVIVKGRDIKLGGQGNFAITGGQGSRVNIEIENYQRVHGDHYVWNLHGEMLKKNVVAGSGDPEKRSGGANSIIEVIYDKDQEVTYNFNSEAIPEWTVPLFTHEFEAATSRAYRYYVQTDTETVSASQLWLEVEYTDSYSSSGAYIYSKVTSDEDISVRTGADDWSQYIEVTGIQPAIVSKVRVKCYCNYYHTTAKIWIDPRVEII